MLIYFNRLFTAFCLGQLERCVTYLFAPILVAKAILFPLYFGMVSPAAPEALVVTADLPQHLVPTLRETQDLTLLHAELKLRHFDDLKAEGKTNKKKQTQECSQTPF